MVKELNMFSLIWLIFNLFCTAEGKINETTTSSLQSLSLRNLCPYNKFCFSDPLKKIPNENFEPCCEECSCDGNCHETGSCCPDMPHSGRIEPKYPCRHLWEFGKDISILETEYNEDWYHVIDGCPNLEKALLHKRCFQPHQFQDYVMVTESKTGKIYRNKDCAECNGVRIYEKLNLRIMCPDTFSMIKLTTHEAREKYLMENCSLRTHASIKDKGLSRCVRKSYVISTCNRTKSWDIYNKEIEMGCTSNSFDQNTIFKKVSASYQIRFYANVFCFLCNVDSQSRKVDICQRSDLDEGSKTGLIPLHVILDSNVWHEDAWMSENTKCSTTQIWDSFSAICRQLYCPDGQIPHYGSCKRLFTNIEGYAIDLNFEVLDQYGSISSDPKILRLFENYITRALGNDISCGLCKSSLFNGTNSTSKFFFRYEVHAKVGCLYDTLSKRVREIALKEKMILNFKYKNQSVHVVFTLIFEDLRQIPGFKVLLQSLHAFCRNSRNVDETILFYCPTIMLPKAEIQTLGLNNKYGHSRIKYSNVTIQQVCVEDYFLAYENSAIAAAYFGTFCVSLIISVIYVNS